MKTSITYALLTVCLIFTCMQVKAQSLTTIYSGEKSPAEENWTELKLDETISPVAGSVSGDVENGVLKLVSMNDAHKFTQLGWYKTDLGLNLQSGYTIEIKAKITNASSYGAFNIQGFDNTGRGFRIGIYKNYLTEYTNPFMATNVLKTGLSNDDDFHIYRITVTSAKIVTLYRDSEEIGTFPLSTFYFDNIITNGGFEDGGIDFENPSFFPDFQSSALLYRTDEQQDDPDQPNFVKTGNYSLIMNSDGKHEATGDNFDPSASERARTKEIPVKPDTKYDISFSRCRVAVEPWAWRDIGAFYDFQPGTQNGVDDRGYNAIWAGANDNLWLTHNQTITTPAENAENVASSLRFEFPSWIRDGDKTTAITAFDDFYLSENYGLIVGQQVQGMAEPVFPANMVNLIENGGFEDWETNNDGSYYEWALSDSNNDNSNEPVEFNPLWNALVRIQKNAKPDESYNRKEDWAHTGESSLRFSTLGDDANKTFVFTKELEAGKSYRFNFWHRNPPWPENAWLKVKIGDNIIWGHRLGSDNNVWANTDLYFTTTNENKTLCLFIDEYSHNWYNIYLDDLVLYEIPGLEDPLLAGKTNLIANGDFEDDARGNNGEQYWWALASDFTGNDDNYPVDWNDMWGTYVRLQDKQKVHDTGLNWAHSGNNSLRFSFLNDKNKAIDAGLPDAFRVNMDFKKELEPNKTYTFVFWIKTANYNDKGDLMIANGNILLWKDQLSTKYIDWSRQSVTFTTSDADHTLRMYTEWTAWCNFYLDDLFLYEDEFASPAADNTFLFFGKSTGTETTNVEIEYVAVNNAGAFAPTGIQKPTLTSFANLNVSSLSGSLILKALNPASVKIYSVAGLQVAQLNVVSEASITLPKGVYIVKSLSKGVTETIKVVNK